MKLSIPTDCKNVNILLSGGADSALLTYLVLKQYDVSVVCHVLNNDEEIFNKLLVPISEYFTNKFGERYKISRM